MDLHRANQIKEDEFLYQLGQALANWQWVEDACYSAYARMMRGADKYLISVSWHHIQSFDARIGLLHLCAHFVFDDAMKSQWKGIHSELRTANRDRNRIVHASYGVRFADGKTGIPSLHASYMDATAIASGRVKDNELRPEHVIHLDKLIEHSEHFKALAIRVRKFAETALPHGLEDEGN